MVTLIAGSRNITSYSLLCRVINASKYNVSYVISGGARGIDSLARLYAREHKIPYREFLADWEGNGRSAGYIRNGEMVEFTKQYNGQAIVIWDGKSKGTKHTIDLCKIHKIKTWLCVYDGKDGWIDKE